MRRHQLRVRQSFCNAVAACARTAQRLYVSVASDEVAVGAGARTDEVRTLLLKKNNLRQVKNLPGTLPLYRGMRLLLYSKECVRLQLMNGCLIQLEEIIFAEDFEEPPDRPGKKEEASKDQDEKMKDEEQPQGKDGTTEEKEREGGSTSGTKAHNEEEETQDRR